MSKSEIYALLEKEGRVMEPKEISNALSSCITSYSTISRNLRDLLRDGFIGKAKIKHNEKIGYVILKPETGGMTQL